MDSRRSDAANATLAVVKQVTYLIKNGEYRRIVEKMQNSLCKTSDVKQSGFLELNWLSMVPFTVNADESE